MDPFEETDHGQAVTLREGLIAVGVCNESAGATSMLLSGTARTSTAVINVQDGPWEVAAMIRLPDGRSIPCRVEPVPDQPGSFTLVPLHPVP